MSLATLSLASFPGLLTPAGTSAESLEIRNEAKHELTTPYLVPRAATSLSYETHGSWNMLLFALLSAAVFGATAQSPILICEC